MSREVEEQMGDGCILGACKSEVETRLVVMHGDTELRTANVGDLKAAAEATGLVVWEPLVKERGRTGDTLWARIHGLEGEIATLEGNAREDALKIERLDGEVDYCQTTTKAATEEVDRLHGELAKAHSKLARFATPPGSRTVAFSADT